ncbi:hypothetical protein MMC22_009565 [Lobaria immixta]|nr:hypothetical protein [Lobaria immixta]
MPESQIALEPVSIFALDKYKPFAATPVETWRTLQSMFADINAFEERRQRKVIAKNTWVDEKDDEKLDWKTDEDGEELYRKYAFLEFTRQQPGLGDPCGELAVRTEVWDEAHRHLGYTPPEEIKEYKEALWRFYEKYSDDDYISFLWQQPSHTLEQISSLLLYAYDEIWAFTQKLKVKELTPLQNRDRQKLKLWIVRNVKHLLFQEELTAICDSKGLDDRTVSHVEIKEARRNVAKKTEKGVWRPLGLQKLNFKWDLD